MRSKQRISPWHKVVGVPILQQTQQCFAPAGGQKKKKKKQPQGPFAFLRTVQKLLLCALTPRGTSSTGNAQEPRLRSTRKRQKETKKTPKKIRISKTCSVLSTTPLLQPPELLGQLLGLNAASRSHWEVLRAGSAALKGKDGMESGERRKRRQLILERGGDAA